MSLRSALAGGAAAAALMAALGNPPVVDAARDADNPVFAETVTGFASWDIAEGTPGDIIAGIVIRLVVAVVVAGLLCAVAGRSRSRGAAFLGGWGALVVAAGIGGAASYAYLMAVPLDGQTGQQSYLDGLVTAVDDGSAFGLWTGWLVGTAVALVARPAPAPAPLPAPTAGAGAGTATVARGVGAVRTRVSEEPPPPWWAPTNAGPADRGVRPGPSVFAPDEPAQGARASGRPLPPPPAPPPSDPDATVVSEPPAPPPSDPDATVVSGPPAPDDATRSFAAPGRSEDDADATAAMPPEDRDRTEPMRRRGR